MIAFVTAEIPITRSKNMETSRKMHHNTMQRLEDLPVWSKIQGVIEEKKGYNDIKPYKHPTSTGGASALMKNPD